MNSVKLLICGAILLAANSVANQVEVAGCGFGGGVIGGRFFRCFRPQVHDQIDSKDQVIQADSTTASIPGHPKSTAPDGQPATAGAPRKHKPDFDLNNEFGPWMEEFQKRSSAITWKSTDDSMASKRILSEMRQLMKEQNRSKRRDLDFLIYVDDTNFYHWLVKFINFDKTDPNAQITKGLERIGADGVVAEIIFPSTYPTDPPFIRNISPKIRSGYLLAGVFCSTLLMHGTSDEHWRPHLSMSTVLQQNRLMFFDFSVRVPFMARKNGRYNYRAALSDYTKRMRKAHPNWKLSNNLDTEMKHIG